MFSCGTHSTGVCIVILQRNNHRRNFTLKSGGDQCIARIWCQGGTTIEGPKARASTRQRRRVGSGMGRDVPSPADYGGLGERRELPQRGSAPAAIAFSACFRPPNASGSNKHTIRLPKLQGIRKNWHFYMKKLQIPLCKRGGDKSPWSHTKLRLWKQQRQS